MQQRHICLDVGPLTGPVFLILAGSLCVLHTKMHNGLRCTKSVIATLCFLLCICATTTGAANCCAHNISLTKQLLVMIEACDTPCILVRVVVTKKKAIGDEICPRPVFGMCRHDRISEASEGTYDTLYTWIHDVPMRRLIVI